MKNFALYLLLINTLISCQKSSTLPHASVPANLDSNNKTSELKDFVILKCSMPTKTKEEYVTKQKELIDFAGRYSESEKLEIFRTISRDIHPSDFKTTHWDINEIDRIIIQTILRSTDEIKNVEEIVTTCPPTILDFETLVELLDRKGISRARQIELITECKTPTAKAALKYAYRLHDQPIINGVRILTE
jgi:hypothetical protein